MSNHTLLLIASSLQAATCAPQELPTARPRTENITQNDVHYMQSRIQTPNAVTRAARSLRAPKQNGVHRLFPNVNTPHHLTVPHHARDPDRGSPVLQNFGLYRFCVTFRIQPEFRAVLYLLVCALCAVQILANRGVLARSPPAVLSESSVKVEVMMCHVKVTCVMH